jgi:hypothetical protein
VTEYVKSTNFASKDALAIGNPLKIVKGTEIDTEFNNIATAVATKADLASPSLTGTPAAPTAAAGTNTTQIATTAFVKTAIDTYDTALTVSAAQIEADAVTTAKILDANVTSAKLANSGVTAATYGSSSAIPSITVNAKGQITSASESALNVLGVSQTWQSPTRSIGTTYTNSTGKPIAVSVQLSIGNNVTATLTVDSVVVARHRGREGAYIQSTYEDTTLFAIVPNGSTYVVSGSSGLIAWTELR